MLGRKAAPPSDTNHASVSLRECVYLTLEGKYAPHSIGRCYEALIVALILASIAAFVIGSLFVPEYNGDAAYLKLCGTRCDMIFFGNDSSNGLSVLGRGADFSTSLLEVITIAVFSVDYLLRLWTADIESPKYAGFFGRLLYIPTFYSVIDLASTLPFYVDMLTPAQAIASTQFLRMFRQVSPPPAAFYFSHCLEPTLISFILLNLTSPPPKYAPPPAYTNRVQVLPHVTDGGQVGRISRHAR